jgi:hypothetical protein
MNQRVAQKLTPFLLYVVFLCFFSINTNCLYIVRGPAENIVQYLERQVILDKPVYCLWSSGKSGSNSFPRPSGRRAYNAGNHRLNKAFVSVPAKIYSRMFSAALSAVQRSPPPLQAMYKIYSVLWYLCVREKGLEESWRLVLRHSVNAHLRQSP